MFEILSFLMSVFILIVIADQNSEQNINIIFNNFCFFSRFFLVLMAINISIIKIYRTLGTYYKALPKTLSFQTTICSDDHK